MLPVYTGGVGPSRRFSLDAAARPSPATAGEGGAHAKRGRVRVCGANGAEGCCDKISDFRPL